MTDLEEIKASIREAAKDKTSRRVVRWALDNIDEKAKQIQDVMLNETWQPPTHKRQTLQEGAHKKTREIEKPAWNDEQIVHHMIMRQFWKITGPRTYHFACGAIKGRGPLYSDKAMEKWIKRYHGRKVYVAELDIKGFYDNIDINILKAKLNRFIRDKRFKNLLYKILDASSPGLPKGFYTSPGLSNFYLMDFDNFVTQELKPDHYLRYMDNLYLFSKNKRELHKMVHAIEGYLWTELHLELNNSKQVFRFEYLNRRNGQVRGRAINCLGFVIHYNRTTLRKSILKRARAKANRIHKLHRYRRRDCAAMLSYMGWQKHTRVRKYFQKYIQSKVSIRYCKKRISILAKRQAKERNNHDELEKCA